MDEDIVFFVEAYLIDYGFQNVSFDSFFTGEFFFMKDELIHTLIVELDT